MNRFQIRQIRKLNDSKYKIRMTPWERDFLESLAEEIEYDEQYELSERQNSTLNKLVSTYS